MDNGGGTDGGGRGQDKVAQGKMEEAEGGGKKRTQCIGGEVCAGTEGSSCDLVASDGVEVDGGRDRG